MEIAMKRSKIITHDFLYEGKEEDLKDQISMVEPFKLLMKKTYVVPSWRFTHPDVNTIAETMIKIVNTEKSLKHNIYISACRF